MARTTRFETITRGLIAASAMIVLTPMAKSDCSVSIDCNGGTGEPCECECFLHFGGVPPSSRLFVFTCTNPECTTSDYAGNFQSNGLGTGTLQSTVPCGTDIEWCGMVLKLNPPPGSLCGPVCDQVTCN